MPIESFAGWIPILLAELMFVVIVGTLVLKELEPPAPFLQRIAAHSLDRVLIAIGVATIAFQVLWIFSKIVQA